MAAALIAASAALAALLAVSAGRAVADEGSSAAPRKTVRLFGEGWERVWRERRIGDRPSAYGVVTDGRGGPVLRGVSTGGVSLLWRSLTETVGSRQRIVWRWSIERFPDGDVSERERGGDDFAARVFVGFGTSRQRQPERSICYVWSAREPVGSAFPSPYADGVMTLVLRSAGEEHGAWRSERRDVLSDFRRLFGQEPPPVTTIGVMVDADDTGSSAAARFADFSILTVVDPEAE